MHMFKKGDTVLVTGDFPEELKGKIGVVVRYGSIRSPMDNGDVVVSFSKTVSNCLWWDMYTNSRNCRCFREDKLMRFVLNNV